ncbi:hypothetical protein OR1_01506 [Geobacter sp. OR-1]|uniref:hypothetical protein n=1 Tax=Geobacter sp. OR-1 TaxID=1266765 RepID=UPI000541E651|nr:hypothetical protein [Geobacter sp. OR-1]GAM09232.1 hypothetical protein OR1_01506 [Geobacter sp. OR-1]
MSGKNLYLLGLQEPANRQPDILESIHALEAEIDRGEAVYTPEELFRLERKLSDCKEFLRAMTQG